MVSEKISSEKLSAYAILMNTFKMYHGKNPYFPENQIVSFKNTFPLKISINTL